MLDKRQFYINGAWVDPRDGTDLEVIDPATEEAVAVISLGGQADTDAAVAAARAAFPGWAATPLEERIRFAERYIEAYEARSEDVAQAISSEMGAPIELARGPQRLNGVRHVHDFIRAARAWEPEHPLGEHAPGNLITHDAIGVCGMITPWNWPLNQVVQKVMPAVIMGCTSILKPSEIAPLSSIVFAEIMDEIGLPPGVFNMVNGDGPGVGTQLSTHKDVDMISFTGSTRAGIAITKAAADTLKRVTLELGGKGANIVFADASDNAVVSGVRQCFLNTGQSCLAPTRMLVERSRYDQAVEEAAKTAEAYTYGQTGDMMTNIGPVVSAAQFEKVQGLIQRGIDEGARLVAGGLGRPEGKNRGYYCRGTIFADVTNDMTIAREEIFGPVLSMMPFDTEEEAIAIANDTDYGLTSYVETMDDEKRLRVARQLRSGGVQTNSTPRGPGAPFGGYKMSGNGREGGIWGLMEYVEVKNISGLNL